MQSKRTPLRVAAALIAAAGGAWTGCGAATPSHPAAERGGVHDSSARSRPAIQPSTLRPSGEFLPGEWTATGTILEAAAADARRGETITRPWDFTTACANGVCRNVFIRYTEYAVQAAPLEMRDGRFVAHFRPVTIQCAHYPGEYAGTSEALATVAMWWSANHETLLGLSQTRHVGGYCGGRTEVIRWVARRTDPAARPPAPGP